MVLGLVGGLAQSHKDAKLCFGIFEQEETKATEIA